MNLNRFHGGRPVVDTAARIAEQHSQLLGPVPVAEESQCRRFQLVVDCNGLRHRIDVRSVDQRTASRSAARELATLLRVFDAHQMRVLSCVEVSA